MLKVFLVEDEFVIREGIKNNIDWSGHGYIFCGEAADGEVAFPMIKKLKPDIVITDIKMPFMDGLTLSKLIKKEMPWIEIIILTGYETFEYAKEALKIGVAEYLSKPVSSEELIKEINQLALKVEKKKQESAVREKYVLEMEENYAKERNELLHYLITGKKTTSELLDMADKLGIHLASIWYNVVLLEIKPLKLEYSSSIMEIEQEIKRFLENGQCIMFDRNVEGKVLLFQGDSMENLGVLQDNCLKKIEELLTPYEDIRYFGCVGKPVNRISDLKRSFAAASRTFAHRYFIDENHIFNSGDKVKMGQSEDEFDISNIDTKQIDRNKIKEFLKVGAKEEVEYFVEEFFKNLSKGALESGIFRQYITMDVYFAVVDFVESMQMSREEIDSLNPESGIMDHAQLAVEYIIKILKQALDVREKSASSKYGDVVEEVKRYIEKNYDKEELSLNIVSAHVNFSPNHLSMIFSQETGQTFIKYLTDYRMNKAKELLRCTGKKSSEIAQEIGYRDPHYFSYVFKKTQNVTPTQFRGGNVMEGED